MSRSLAKRRANPKFDKDEQLFWDWKAARESGHFDALAEAEAKLAVFLRRFAKRTLRKRLDRDESEVVYELADAAVAKIMTELGKFRGQSKFTSYAWQIIDTQRKRWLRDQRHYDRVTVTVAEPDETLGEPDNPAYAKVFLEQLRGGCTPAEQAILDGKLIGESDWEICKRMGWVYHSHCSNGVQTRWQRLKTRLRQQNLAGTLAR